MRAGAALGPFDVARFSERTDEQELRMHGDGTEGGSQGNRAHAGAAAERRRAARHKILIAVLLISDVGRGWRLRFTTRAGDVRACALLTDYAQGRPRV